MCLGDQKGCNDHREVGDCIGADEQPDRAHVGVSFAEAREDERGRHVHDEGGEADPAHQLAFWNARVERTPNRESDDSDAQRAEEQALSQRGKRTGARAPCKREEAHERDRAVTEKIERISLERLAVGDEPSDKLAEPEATITQDDEPTRTTKARANETGT